MEKTLRHFQSLTLLLLFLAAPLLSADNVNYYFKQISIEQGLSQGTVNCLQLDHSGVIWIGTNSGLNTFDKNEFKTYLHESNTPYSLPGNTILFVVEDAQNKLWISTNNGLVTYNPRLNNFKQMLPQVDTVYGYLLLEDGILFSVAGAFYRYSYADQTLKKELLADKYLSFVQMHAMGKDKALLTSQNAGVYAYRPTTGQLSRLSSTKGIMTSCADSKGRYYTSSYKDGVRGFSAEGKELFHLTTDNSDLAGDIVLCMIFHQGKLWVGTDGGGISIIQPETPHHIVTLQHKPGNDGTLPNNSIKTLYADKRGNLWAGTVRDGMFGIRQVPIHTYKDVHLLNTEGISEKVVNCLFEDADGTLWIGTDGGGVNRYDASENRFTHYPQTFGHKIVSIGSYSTHELLVSDYEGGLRIFNKLTLQFRPFTILSPSINARECFSGYAVFLDHLSSEEIFIESLHTYLYNTRTKAFREVTTSEDPSQLEALRLIYADSTHLYFKGGNRVLEADREKLVLKTLFKTNENEYINSACYDGKGIFWIGTDYGLSSYDVRKKRRTPVRTGLFSGVSMLFLDEQQRLWVSAHNVLFSYHIAENRFALWGESDGFTANELLSTPITSNHYPVYYMGGVSGFTKVNKNISINDYYEPTVKLTGLTVDGTNREEVPARIELPYDYRSLSVRVTSEETDMFRNVLFRYTIQGLSQEPIETYRYNFTLPQLTPGDYTVLVSCNTKSGNWTTPVSLLAIHVDTPWYRHPLVVLLAVILLLLTLLGVNFYLIRRKETELKWAMKEHEQQVYEEKIKFLINISHELRTPLTLIYAPLKRLLEQFPLSSESSAEEDRRHHILNGIYKQTKQMKDIINMVLDLNKMGQTELTIAKTIQPLNLWVREVTEDFREEFAARGIALTYQWDEAVGQVCFEKAKCEIVLSNLLMNALKFSKPATTVTVSSQQKEGYVRVSVSDQGIGLNHTDSEQLFSRFYQGKHSQQGTGIGLSYAKKLIDLHGGCIGAYNNPEAGATFYYELPLETENTPSVWTEPEQADCVRTDLKPGAAVDTQPYSLLIVEDKEELRNFLKDELKPLFAKIYTASDGQKGLALVRELTPDLIVSDIMMPCMDGFELCKCVKEDLSVSHIPVILLTARTDENSTALGYKLGADAYLAKPFELDTLLAVICNQLGMRQRIRQFFGRGLTDESMINALTTTNADETFVKQMNEVITSNLDNPELDVNFLVQQMNMSRTPFYNKVKALTGIGVNDYINTLRIQRAKELLAGTERSITEIADSVGFTYQRYFSTLFKQMVGISPTDYRKQESKSSERLA